MIKLSYIKITQDITLHNTRQIILFFIIIFIIIIHHKLYKLYTIYITCNKFTRCRCRRRLQSLPRPHHQVAV